jgi:enoyl-CoA hydratase/carnithine racemase
MSDLVRFEIDAAIARLTLDRPQKLNAMNDDMLLAMIEHLQHAAADPGLRVLILAAKGRAFSAGGDIASFENMDAKAFAESVALYMRLARAFRELPAITIAAVNGYALAGGFELALMCDLRISAASAVYGLPDASIGLSPTSGMTWLLPRIVGYGRALHLTLTGEQIDAAEAERIGLVTAVVEDDALHTHVDALARKIAACPGPVVAKTKAAFVHALEHDFGSATTFEERAELDCFRAADTRAALGKVLRRKK